MSRFKLLLAACVAAVAIHATDGEDVVVFEDRFANQLGEGWSWIREDAADWCIRDETLAIRVVPGDANTVENALIRAAPDRRQGVYAIEVTVTNETVPSQQYEQAGLTWYVDEKPAFKLVKERVDGELRIVPGHKPMASRSVRLRLIVTADSFTAQYRPEGETEYLTAATGPLPPPANDRVSIQCYHGPPAEEQWIRFDDFRIVRLGAAE